MHLYKDAPWASWLDEGSQVRLGPDISWWEGARCHFVGDVKYKRVDVADIPDADLYQLLAYCTAAELPAGLLIYAAGERPSGAFTVAHTGKRLQVTMIDLSAEPDAILDQTRDIAARVCEIHRGRPAHGVA